MICLLAENRLEALRFAFGQQMKQTEWFHPNDVAELYIRSNFHVIVLPGFANLPSSYRDRIHQVAMDRKVK